MDQNDGRYRLNIEDAATIRRLAGGNTPAGWATLRLGRREHARLRALLRRAEAFTELEDEALSRLKREARRIAACAREASQKGGRLPAWRGRPRLARP